MIELKSRYGEPRFIEKISDNEYLIYGKTNWIRSGDNFVDFESGPFLIVGGIIPTTDLKITKINRMGNKGDMSCYKLTV